VSTSATSPAAPVAHERGWSTELYAALAVLALMVPQGMAYAMLAGLPPATGLFVAAVAPIAYATVGSSRWLSVGPFALTALLAAGGLQAIAAPEDPRYVGLAIAMSAMVGVVLLVLAALRAGFLANFLGHPAIVGFTAAAALLTAASQLRQLCGLPASAAQGVTAENPWPVFLHLQSSSALALAFGLGTLAMMSGLPRIQRRVPAALAACGLAIAVVSLLGADALGLATVGEVPRALPSLEWPALSFSELRALAPSALTIAIVSYGLSVALAKSLAVKHRQQIEPNRELWALGLANLAAAAVSGFPVSASLSRTLVAVRAGARTRMCGVLVGVGVILTLLVAGPVFAALPLSVLAAIVIHSALQLVDPREALVIWRTHRSDGITMLATFAATLALGLVEGLAVGLLIALLLFVRRSVTPHTAELGRIPGSMVYRNTQRYAVEVCPQVGILRVDAPLYFANARFLEDRIHRMFAERPHMLLLALDCSAIHDVDATAIQSLRSLVLALRERGNDMHLVGPIGPVRDVLERTGMLALLGEHNLHRSIIEAAPTLMARIDRRVCEGSCRVSAFPECTLIPRSGAASPTSEAARFSPQI
jgi:sulfate permease, SulP family